jgi:CubicO group peptidase (beta-lactamase class C family)
METDLHRRALANRIDRLIEPWRSDTTPGVTVGVVEGDVLVAHRHAGLASLELGVPIGAETCFRIASVSKQFTCAAALLLAERGQLDIEAPVRSLLPDLPAACDAVTVAQLMHNASGIRDMLEILRHGGADLGTPVTATDLLDGIRRQRTLNFAPGTRYLYSNSNFLLLGLVVERLAGAPLAAVLEREIFAPLGMTSTRHTPDVQTPVRNLATGYVVRDGSIVRAAHAFPLGGEGGLVSSVVDLAIWAANARTGRVPGPGVIAALERATPFRNGTPNHYARGLRLRRYRGVPTVSHGGLWPGYRTEFLRTPRQDAAVIVIANHGGIDPNLLAHRVLDIVLDRHGAVAVPPLPAKEQVAGLAGRYMDPDTGATLDIDVAEDGTVTFTANGLPATAEVTEDGRLGVPRSGVPITVRGAGPDAVEVEQDAGVIGLWRRVARGATLPDDLPGSYVSDEMGAHWIIARGDGGMSVRAHGPVVRGPAWPLEAITAEDVRVHIPATVGRSWLDVRIRRNAEGAITDLVVQGGRVKSVRYARQPAG